MTCYFPDVSSYQAGISLAGAPAAAIKSTEGTGWTSSDYAKAIGRARSAGCYPIAYHFLHAGSASAQAARNWRHHRFIDAYRKLGGVGQLSGALSGTARQVPHDHRLDNGCRAAAQPLARQAALLDVRHSGGQSSRLASMAATRPRCRHQRGPSASAPPQSTN